MAKSKVPLGVNPYSMEYGDLPSFHALSNYRRAVAAAITSTRTYGLCWCKHSAWFQATGLRSLSDHHAADDETSLLVSMLSKRRPPPTIDRSTAGVAIGNNDSVKAKLTCRILTKQGCKYFTFDAGGGRH